MHKFIFIAALFGLLSAGCSGIKVPDDFAYKEIETRDFKLASWQKISEPDGVYKFYIEGDGHAFDSRGRPTADPTPQGTMLRELAFGDPSPNVIYLARPCQYIMSPICAQRHWTTARFAPEAINAEYDAVRQTAGGHEVILVGFSGGAQVAGRISAAKPGLRVKKLVTIAGNLDPLAWTTYHGLPPINESLSLESYRRQYLEIPQIHYAGSDDKVMPAALIEDFVGGKHPVVRVEGATHNSGWEKIYLPVRQEK